MDAAFHQVYSKILSQMDQGCSLMLPSSVQHPRIISTFLEACRALWGSWAQGLCVPHFLDYKKQPSFSLHDLPWVPRKVKAKPLSRVRLFATPWTVAHQAPLSKGFSRQEYWSGLPFPSPGDLPDREIEPRCPALQVDALTSEPPGKPTLSHKGNPRILEWVAYPFSSGSSWPRSQTGVSCIAGWFST